MVGGVAVALLILFPPWQTRDTRGRFLGHRPVLRPGFYVPDLTVDATLPDQVASTEALIKRMVTDGKSTDNEIRLAVKEFDQSLRVPVLAWRVLVTELLTVVIIASALFLLLEPADSRLQVGGA